MNRRNVVVGLLLALVAAGLLARRDQPTSEEAVRAVIDQFCAGIESRHINESLKLVSSRFHGDGMDKSDLIRGLWTVNRDFQMIDIHTEILRLRVSEDQRSATALVEVAIIGDRGGAALEIGTRAPLQVTARFEREGRRWKIVGSGNWPTLGYWG